MSRRSRADAPTRIRNQFGTFAQIPADLVKDPKMSDRAIRVYALLWVYSSDIDRDAFPSRATMATDLDVSKATIDRGVGELVRRGAITVEETFAGDRQTSNPYTIIAPLPPRQNGAEVIHRGRKFEAPPASNLEPSGAANLRLQEQEPEEQELGPVPNATTDAAAAWTGPSITPKVLSATHGQELNCADVFAAVGKSLPDTFDDAALEQLAAEILGRSATRVLDPTGYVIRALRNPDGRLEWLTRALDIDIARHLAKTGTAGF